jgi:isopentenyldiphosphate isomerase
VKYPKYINSLMHLKTDFDSKILALADLELPILDISNSLVYPKKSLDEVVEFEIDYIMTNTSDTIETIKNTEVSGYPARMVI